MMQSYLLGPEGYEQVLSGYGRKMQIAHRQITRDVRTADGTLKRDLIAVKRVWQVSYSWLPSAVDSVDDVHGMGRDELYALYLSNAVQSFHIPQDDADDSWEDVSVMFGADSWSESLRKRTPYNEFGRVYALSFTLEEV